MRTWFMTTLLLVFAASPGGAQDTPVAIRNATILTGAGATIRGGTLVFEGGKIVDVGADVTPPDGSDVIDAEGLYATPGFIDAYTHVGLGFSAVWDRDALMVTTRRVSDALSEAGEGGIDAAQWIAAGVTTVYTSPGGQNLVGGTGAVVKLTGELLREDAALSASFGEAALDAFEGSDAPTTRQGMIAILRQTLVRAQEDAGGEDGRVYARLLAEELPFRVLVNTPDDILTALRIAREFGLDLVLDSAAGGHVVKDAIAAANVPVVVGPAIVGLGDGGPYEGYAHTPSNAASLHAAGVPIALSTGGLGRGRSVAMEAVVAKSHGLDEDAALAAVTSSAASILGVGDRVGTLAKGLDADIVLWKGHPVSTWGETVRVIVNGRTAFER